METKIQNPSYGIGIDVSKEELVTSIRSSNGLKRNQLSFANNTTGIKKFIEHLKQKQLPKETPILLESTGPYHWLAACQLSQANLNAKVVNPLHTKYALKHSIRKRKTDKVDAHHLAMLAWQGYGYSFQETEELAQLKALVRHYWKLKIQAANNVRHERYLKKYRAIEKFSVSGLILKQAKATKKEILSRFKGNDLKYLDTIPGITPILAATILAELLPLNRFKRTAQLIALAGLDPQVKQSGSKEPRFGKLSKRGSPILRSALYMAAFGVFNRKPFKKIYDKYKARGLHHTTILCILARKILRISWALLRKRQVFDEKYLAVDN